MGNYSIPDNIKCFKPKGKMIKAINGHYYVYNYSSYTDKNTGKRKTRMGSCIGSIKEGIGFVPNDNYNKTMENTTLEYGQYAIVYANTRNVLSMLLDVFNPVDAYSIYLTALIYFVEGFTYLKYLNSLFEMSYFSALFPDITLSYHKISKLLDSLGRKQGNVIKFQQRLIEESSKELAFDGHVINSYSHENDLTEYGNKYHKTQAKQINVMMGYDINTNAPVFSRIFEGGKLDKTSIQDVFVQYEFKNTLFIVDRGFYSKKNIELMSTDGNKYIIPLAPNLNDYKEAVKDLNLDKSFVYSKNKEDGIIQYREILKDNRRIIVYRDYVENSAKCNDYMVHLTAGEKGFSQEEFEKVKDYFGLIVLETNCMDKSIEEIYCLYKKRWRIETFFDYFKNTSNIESLYEQDYYKLQGMSFIMLIYGLIHSEMKKVVSKQKGKNINDCLIEGRFVKIHKSNGKWSMYNVKKERKKFLDSMNVDPDEVPNIK